MAGVHLPLCNQPPMECRNETPVGIDELPISRPAREGRDPRRIAHNPADKCDRSGTSKYFRKEILVYSLRSRTNIENLSAG